LLRKNNYETEDYAYLLFYVTKEIKETGEITFDKELIKMPINIKNAEKVWNSALNLLNNNCPEERCDWCNLIKQVKK